MRTAGPRYSSLFHQYEGQDVLQQAQVLQLHRRPATPALRLETKERQLQADLHRPRE
jgi:hypothetical protein